MKQVFIYNLIIGTFLSLPFTSTSQSLAKKILTDTISVEDFAEIKIENEYGNVVISTWEEPTIAYEFSITVEKRNEDDAEDLIKRIEANVTNFGRLVTISSKIADKEENFFTRLLSDIPLELDKSDVDIDLTISIPKDVELEVINAFGNVVILDFDGKLRCDLKHGDLKVKENLKSLDLNHSYGNVDIKSSGLSKLHLRNSEVRAKSISDLRLESQGSEIEIENIDYLNIESNKDELRIIHVEKIRGEMRFGNVFIDQIGKEIWLELRVTDLRVSKLNDSSPTIFLDQQNSEVDISISNTSFELKADLEDGVLRLPESFNNIKSDVIDEKDNKRVITGQYGSGSMGDFELKGKRGYVILREI